jgi:hypothetical protein
MRLDRRTVDPYTILDRFTIDRLIDVLAGMDWSVEVVVRRACGEARQA